LEIWQTYESNFAARSLCDDFVARLAQGIGGALTILNPAQLVLGGSLATALGETLLQPLRARLKDFCLPAHFAHLPVGAGKLGDDAAALGAVALAMQNSQ
jgi:predicted NBD/HSP70 family sugar kinase